MGGMESETTLLRGLRGRIAGWFVVRNRTNTNPNGTETNAAGRSGNARALRIAQTKQVRSPECIIREVQLHIPEITLNALPFRIVILQCPALQGAENSLVGSALPLKQCNVRNKRKAHFPNFPTSRCLHTYYATYYCTYFRTGNFQAQKAKKYQAKKWLQRNLMPHIQMKTTAHLNKCMFHQVNFVIIATAS